MMYQRVLGIDYGSKMAGTTVVAYQDNGEVKLVSSVKGKDADKMLLQVVQELKPDLIAIDAPLSLPGVFTGLSGCDDYFYRECDKLTKAMSPMFLGGLTARAMKLTAHFRKSNIKVIEAYPVKAGIDIGLKAFGYRTKEQEEAPLLEHLKERTGLDIRHHAQLSGHMIDAVLALFIANKFALNQAGQLGSLREGLIFY